MRMLALSVLVALWPAALAAQGDDPLPDLVDLMQEPDPDMAYLLQRCAAYFRSEIQVYGRNGLPEAEFQSRDDRVRYFLNADILIQRGDGVPEEEATDTSVAAMMDISALYLARMQANHDAGQHPFSEDVMLQRDRAGCEVVYQQRETP